MKIKRIIPFAFLLLILVNMLAGCGGGGGGSAIAPVAQKGYIQGYVYVPVGGARVTVEIPLGIMRAANAVPAGYAPLSGATVSCGGMSTVSNVNGYYFLPEITAGLQTVTISKTGYQTITINKTIISNVTVTVTQEGSTAGSLIPTEVGSVSVTSTPSGATIYIDGYNSTFTTPHTFTNIKTGSHQINVVLSGYSVPMFQMVSATTQATPGVAFTLTAGGDSVSELSTGGNHNCALMSTGGVTCWGSNTYGELGDGTTTDRSAPVGVTGLTSGVAAISTGGGRSCAVMTNGDVKCWGNNYFGSLGDGTTAERHTPVYVYGLGAAVSAVSIGYYHACALTTSGGVKCWGRNKYGEVGDGTTNERDIPVDVTGLTSGVTAISAGSAFSCALMSTGGVKCWGDNQYGVLADGTKTERHTPVDIPGLTSGVTAIVAAGSYVCALTTSGGVKCWGTNFNGAIGDGTTTDRYAPVDVTGLTSGVSAISANYLHTCALTTSGGVKCWGSNVYGEIGDGTTVDKYTPVDVTGLTSGVAAISTGAYHTCALYLSGRMKCWGINENGELGDGTIADKLTPAYVIGF